MKIERWNPVNEFNDVTNFMRNVFNEAFAVPATEYGKRIHAMHVNIFEKNNEIFLEAELPGFTKDNIDVGIENGYLTITAKKEVKEDNEKKYYVREIKNNVYSRTFEIGEGVETDNIKAEYNNGILTLILRKPEIKKGEVKKIEIN